MAFSLTKIFGNKTSKKQLKSNDSIDAIINDVENAPFGISENNALFAGLNELGGYFFFQTVIVGTFKLKTMQGANLSLHGEGFELKLNSDMQELESDPTPVRGRNITKIDFQIEESDIENLQSERITKMRLVAKKQDVVFIKHLSTDEEEE